MKPRTRGLTSLSHLLQRGIVTGADIEELLETLRVAFAAQGVAITHGARFQPWTRAEGVSSDWMAAHESVRQYDPCIPWLATSPPGSVFRIRGSKSNMSNPTYAEFKRQGYLDGSILQLSNPGKLPSFVIVYREKGARPMTGDDAALLSLLHPALERALAATSATAALFAPRDETLDQATERFIAHAFVALPARKVIWPDGALAALGGRAGDRATRGLRLRLEQALLRAIDERSGIRFHIERDLDIEVAYVPPERKESRRVLVMFIPAETQDHAEMPLALLTARQREVAIRFANGDSTHEIAGALGIGRETVRDHVRAAYERVGVRSRVELARLLARS